MPSRAITSEDDLIAEFLAPLAAGAPGAYGLKDDCATAALPPGHEFVLKTDAIAEGVHFLADERPEDVGWKALAVNVSDLAAKGAAPYGYLMSLAFPQAPTRDWMSGFAAGLAEAQAAFGLYLLGGDTDRRPGPIAITPMVLGIVPAGRAVLRMGAQVGHVIVVTGSLGDAALGLALRRKPRLTGEWGLGAANVRHLLDRYRRPQPRLAVREALRAHAAAAMDVSDGIARDVGRMARAANVSARLEAGRLPQSDALAAVAQRDPRAAIAAQLAGDDYEILAAMPDAEAARYIAEAGAAGVSATIVGRFEAGSGVAVQGADGRPISLAPTGWDHFRPADTSN